MGVTDQSRCEIAVDPATVRAQVARMITDPIFNGSHRIRKLLSAIVERTLESPSEGLKEYSLAVDVFDRPASFDPRLDPVVRVQASNLRAKLRQYYASRGANDPVRIEIPRGGYAAQFSSKPPKRDVSPSIVVLPCIDLSRTRDQEHFCDGITEEVISALSVIEGVRVAGRTSSFYYKNNVADLSHVGARLGVDHALETSCRRQGRRIRVTARLMCTASGFTLWSRSFESDAKDIFAVQQEIATSVAAALNLPANSAPADNPFSGDLEAYHLFLLGRFHLQKRTLSSLRKSIMIFRKLLSGKITHAPVFASLAECHVVMCLAGASRARVAMPTAERLAKRALSLNPPLPEAHAILATIRALYRWDWKGAESTFERALQLNPNQSIARAAFACFCLAPAARLDEALTHLEAAVNIDPLSLATNFALAFGLYMAGRFSDVVARCEKILEIEPAFSRAVALQGLALHFLGRSAEALERATLASKKPDDFVPTAAAAACVFALEGKRDRVQPFLERRSAHGSCYWTALVLTTLDQKNEALQRLNEALRERDPWVVFAACDPLLQALRRDKIFQLLLKRMNLCRGDSARLAEHPHAPSVMDRPLQDLDTLKTCGDRGDRKNPVPG